MTPAEIETVYEALARQIDAIAPDKHALFLAKLALLLSREIGDAERARSLVAEAARNLDV